MASSPAVTQPAVTQQAATVDTVVAPGNKPSTGTAMSTGSGKTLNATRMDSGAAGSGVLSRDGRGITERFRSNVTLAADVRQLDESLQRSRRSAFVSLLEHQGKAPDLVKRRLANQDTVGRYVVNKPLAAGGMGAVLDISDHDFQRQAAMKVMHARFAQQPEALERFLDEAQITAQLEHPNIVPIHDLGVTPDGNLFYTMKMIEGESLGDVVKGLRNNKPGYAERWNEEFVLLTFLKALDGLSYAHEHGVVHRDIKPDNIMIENYGEVLVVDWGLAKVINGAQGKPEADLEDLSGSSHSSSSSESSQARKTVESFRDALAQSNTMDGAIMGTPQYMPPEQAQGQLSLIDARSDIFSMGATLYELLCHQRMYPTNIQLPELLMKVVNGDIIPMEQWREDLHIDLKAIVLKSLSLDRSDRYDSCQAFAADIRQYLAGKAVLARQRNIIERIGAWVGAHKVHVLVTAAMLLVLATGIFGSRYMQQQANREQAEEYISQAQIYINDLQERKGFSDFDFAINRAQEALTLVEQASVLAADHPQVIPLRSSLSEMIGGYQQQRKQAVLAAEAAAEFAGKEKQAQAWWQEAQALQQQGALAPALQRMQEAYRLAPGIELKEAIDEDIDRLAILLADSERAERITLAQENIRTAQTLLTQVQGAIAEIPVVDQTMTWQRQGQLAPIVQQIDQTQQELTQAQEVLATAQELAGDMAIDQMAGLTQQTGALGQTLMNLREQTTNWQQRYEESVVITTRSQGDYDALLSQESLPSQGVLNQLRDRVTQAIGLLPSNDQAMSLHQAISLTMSEVIAAEAAQAKLAEQLAIARERQQQFASALADWRDLTLKNIQLDEKLAELKQNLQGAAMQGRQTIWQTSDDLNAVLQQRALAWSEAERIGLAAETLWRSVDDPDGLLSEVQNNLAELYADRYQSAVAEEDLVGLATYQQLVEQYDQQKRFALAASGKGQLTISGSSGVNGQKEGHITAQPLARQLTRLQPTGDSQQVSQGQNDLPAGRWRLSNAVAEIDMHLPAGGRRELWFPESKPEVTLPKGEGARAGERETIALNYVSAPDGGKGFWLGTYEITHAQYGQFVQDTAQWRQVVKHFRTIIDVAINGNGRIPASAATFPFVPFSRRTSLESGVNWPQVEHDWANEQIGNYVIPAAINNWPVSGITRQDAELFCQWLSKQTGHTIRLPRRDEWQWAAQGGDTQRIYPWGDTYDPLFVAGQRAGVDTPYAVGDVVIDRGPFGHQDLGGSVREWLADGIGIVGVTYDGAVAGGGWTDAQPERFRSQAIEAVPATTVHEQIGFRILVE